MRWRVRERESVTLQTFDLWSPLLFRHGKIGGARQGGFGSGRVNWVSGQTGYKSKRVILNGLKTGLGQSGCGSSPVDPYFLHEFFIIFYFYKENNMYLPFGKLCNKLLNVKYIILNSPLISRMNLVKLINTYSIIFKIIQILTLLSKTK